MKSENDMGFGYLVKVLGSYQETFLLACSLEESLYVIYCKHIILFVIQQIFLDSFFCPCSVKVNDNLLDIKKALFTRTALRYSFSFPTEVLGFWMFRKKGFLCWKWVQEVMSSCWFLYPKFYLYWDKQTVMMVMFFSFPNYSFKTIWEALSSFLWLNPHLELFQIWLLLSL